MAVKRNAEIIGKDADSDLAVLKIFEYGLSTAKLGDASD